MRSIRKLGPAMKVPLILFVAAGIAAADNLDLVRLLQERPWLMSLSHQNPAPHHQGFELQSLFDQQRLGNSKFDQDDTADDDINDTDDFLRSPSDKRSAVATVLNGRRRRQPAPAFGKIVTPPAGVGILNDMGMFFGSLRDNLEVLASLSPEERASLVHNVPSVVQAPTSGSGGGSGMRRLHALRPLRPTGNIRSYNRRSFVEADGVYPGANNHDPGLLWTGLGRR